MLQAAAAEKQDFLDVFTEGVYQFPNGIYLAVQECDDGVDFTAYDASYREIDGGQVDMEEIPSMSVVLSEILDLMDWQSWGVPVITEMSLMELYDLERSPQYDF